MPPSMTTEKKLTPMMEQYRSIKKTLPAGTFLFFRLGDFYEMFFEDAVRASEILDITLTGRDAGTRERVPMCGVPHHSFQGYVKTLIDHNHKVAICEQIGDPKASKGIVERKISRIITPATYLDDETDRKQMDYMAAVVEEADSGYAIAYLEMSTGEFFVREIQPERIYGELSLLSPREVILSKSLQEQARFSGFLKESLNASLTVYEDWVFERDETLRLLMENYQLVSERGLSFSGRPLCVRAAGAILYYLRDHMHSALEHVRLPVLLDSSDFMVLDRQTQKSLELVSSMNGKKETGSLLSCLDQTLTSMGGRTLYQWITHPLLSPEEIQKRQDAIQEWRSETERLNTFRGLLKGVKDMERTLSRLNYGVANARDLMNLKIFLERVPFLQEVFAPAKSNLLKELRSHLNPFEDLKTLIAQGVVDEPPLGLKDGGMIRDGYSSDLDELRRISKNAKNWLLEFEKKEIERTKIKSLKLKYSQVFGYAIEVSKSNLHLVPEDYIRRQTLANAERFIVPELKAWDEKISGAQDKIKALEYELFCQLRQTILAHLVPLQAMAKAVGQLDSLGSLALTALQKNWVRPEVSDSGELLIEAGRHPVVEAMLPSGQFVENDLQMDERENQLVVLTGPNMAGKSTYIRQAALMVLLAQMGSCVPAKRARIGLVDRIFTRIGATDDLARGESTFMVEMLETAHILQSATNRSLLILDEVGRGTSTFDGVSIAWAICEYLAEGKSRPRTLFATHYHELTQLEEHFPGIKNYHITVKETKSGIVFLRKVVRGGTDRSYGIHVARLAGIPETVTRRAREILHILESENTEATQIIEGKSGAKKAKAQRQQPTLFDVQVQNHPIVDEMTALEIDGMTPLEALNQLAAWKKRLKDGNH